MRDIVEMLGMAKKLSEIVRAAKLIYDKDWPEKKKQALEMIDAYMIGAGKETRLSAAIAMSSIANDQKLTVLLLGAAADSEETTT